MQNLYCPKCGQNLNGNTNLKFCPKCGAKIQTNISGNNKKQDDIDKLMNSDFIQSIKLNNIKIKLKSSDLVSNSSISTKSIHSITTKTKLRIK